MGGPPCLRSVSRGCTLDPMSPFEGWTLAIALLSLAVAGWGAWQAKAANTTADKSLSTAKEANGIAREAASAAVSALPVEFKVRPVHTATGDGPARFVGVELRNEGAALYVHSLQLEGYGVISADGFGSAMHTPVTDRSLPMELTISHPLHMSGATIPIEESQLPAVPVRMHRGEVQSFRLPEPMTPGDMSSLDVLVRYSLSGEREEASRHVHRSVVSYRERYDWGWAKR